MASSPAGSVTQRARGSKPDKAETTLRVGLRVTRPGRRRCRAHRKTLASISGPRQNRVSTMEEPQWSSPRSHGLKNKSYADLCALVQEEGALHENSAIFYRDWILTVDLQEAISDKVRRLINTFTTAFVFVQL